MADGILGTRFNLYAPNSKGEGADGLPATTTVTRKLLSFKTHSHAAMLAGPADFASVGGGTRVLLHTV